MGILVTDDLRRVRKVNGILNEIFSEVLRAVKLHPAMHSPHEMESVIREEFEEVWDEVKAFNLPKGRDTRPQMRTELIQLAAMAVRGILEVTDGATDQVSIRDSQGISEQQN